MGRVRPQGAAETREFGSFRWFYGTLARSRLRLKGFRISVALTAYRVFARAHLLCPRRRSAKMSSFRHRAPGFGSSVTRLIN